MVVMTSYIMGQRGVKNYLILYIFLISTVRVLLFLLSVTTIYW
jgi:hypothetical protein